MPIATKLDRSIVQSIRRDAQGRDQFVVDVCDVWLSGQAADGTSVEYATEILQELAANVVPTPPKTVDARFEQSRRNFDVAPSKHSMDIAARLATDPRLWPAIRVALAYIDAQVPLARLVQIFRDAQTSWLAEQLSDETKPNRRPASPTGWQGKVIGMAAGDNHAAVTITVDGTTGGVVTLIWDAETSRWELPGPTGWASAGLMQLPAKELAMCADLAVQFANWR